MRLYDSFMTALFVLFGLCVIGCEFSLIRAAWISHGYEEGWLWGSVGFALFVDALGFGIGSFYLLSERKKQVSP